MARVKPIHLIAEISGRVAHTDQSRFLTNHRTGKVYSAALPKDVTSHPPTPRQLEVRQQFRLSARAAKEWRALHAPSPSQPDGTAEWQAMQRQYQAQHKIGIWMAFVRSKYRDGSIPSFIEGE